VKKVSQEKIVKKTKQQVMYAVLLSLVTFVRFLPRRAALSMMRGLGWAAFYLLKSKRLRTLRHLSAAFDHEKSASDIHRIARQAFLNFGVFCADALLIPRIMGSGIDELITAEGIERLDGLSRNNQGAIMLTAHFGNWELLGAWFAKRGYKVKVIGAPHSNPWINRMIADARNRAGYQSIERGNHTREILRALAEGYSIGVLIDQDTKADGVFVRFLNQWANTPLGPVRLARKYGLKIIPIFIRLKSDDTYHVEVKEPLPLEFTGDKRRDLIVNTQMCSEACEKMIRRHPEQWLWMMRRGNKQPEGETLEACEGNLKGDIACGGQSRSK
jgi:KDO2-lipid IV(A) lauroyltransferase